MSEFLEIRSGWSEDSLYQDIAAAGAASRSEPVLSGAVATMQNNENKCVH